MTDEDTRVSEEQPDEPSEEIIAIDPEDQDDPVAESEEEAKEDTSKDQLIKAEDVSSKKPSEEPSEDEEEEEKPAKKPKEKSDPSVPLTQFSQTKDVLYRLATSILEDDDKLHELSENDPKLLSRLKKEFPKKFKDVEVKVRELTEEDIQRRIDEAVDAKLKGTRESLKLDEFRIRIGLREIEFEDIREDLTDKANMLLETEAAGTYSEALLQAYQIVDSKKAKKLLKQEAVKELHGRETSAQRPSGVTKSKDEKFTKIVLENFKRLGFKSPEEMVKYQRSDDISIIDHIKKG